MFLGFEDSLKKWKKDLKASGANMSDVKAWQKNFDKVQKQAPILEAQYVKTKQDLETVYGLLQAQEKALAEGKSCGEVVSSKEFEQTFSAFSNKMKQYQNNFNHEFLISKEDTEFHLTYKSIVNLCDKKEKAYLILQSEIENLLAVTKEALEKEWPDFRAMAFFYIGRTDKEISDIPHTDKVEKVMRVYENEFLQPMYRIMEECYGAEKAHRIMEVDLWAN